MKNTLENILSSIEDAGILNNENLHLLNTASREYQAVVTELKKIDGSKFGVLSDDVKPFIEDSQEARTGHKNVENYHAFRTELVRKIEEAINLL